jgi:hypothetical protein
MIYTQSRMGTIFLFLLCTHQSHANDSSPESMFFNNKDLRPFLVKAVIDTANPSDNLQELRRTLGALARVNKAFSHEVKQWVNPIKGDGNRKAVYLLQVARTKVFFRNERDDGLPSSTQYLAAAYLGTPYALHYIEENLVHEDFQKNSYKPLDFFDRRRSYACHPIIQGKSSQNGYNFMTEGKQTVILKFPPSSQLFLHDFLSRSSNNAPQLTTITNTPTS